MKLGGGVVYMRSDPIGSYICMLSPELVSCLEGSGVWR